LLALSCANTFANYIILFISVLLCGLDSFLITLVSFIYIILTILKIKSAESRQKAFSTCTVAPISLFRVYFIFQPTVESLMDPDNMISIQYKILTPMLNPIIYSLKNKEIRSVLLKITYPCSLTRLEFCGPNIIRHFSCEFPSLLALSCTETTASKIMFYVTGGIVGMFTFSLTLVSYINIFITILKMNSAEARKKTFSTCSSHLIVVALFYVTGYFRYLRPNSISSVVMDELSSVQYSISTPMLNPIIYSLTDIDELSMENQTMITEFILLGLSSNPEIHMILFFIFLIIYTITLLGNILIILIIRTEHGLYTPMFFFLSHLAFIDICYSTVTVPKMMANCIANQKDALVGCIVQIFSIINFACIDFSLLSAMAYDHYFAICNLLHYYTTLLHYIIQQL
ncbi:Olfactory receptor 24, partial [Ophiophagus hannah]